MIDDRVREQAASAQHDIAVIESMIEDQVRPIRERLEHDMAHGNRPRPADRPCAAEET